MSQVKSLKTGIKFKDTPIGKIPVDWEVATLDSICNEIYRYPTYYNIKYVAQEGGVPEVRGELIKENGKLDDDLSNYRFISKETSSQFPRTVLHEGDFVVSVRGTLGKIGYVSAKFEGANITANLIRFSPKHDQTYPLWLKQILLSDVFQKKLHGVSSATTIKTITAPELKGLNIPLPPFFEQKKIAEILTTVDDGIEETDRIIEKTKELKKGLMQKLLTRGIGHKKFKKTEIGEIPEEWRITELSNIFKLASGKSRPSEISNMPTVKMPYPIYGGNGIIGFSDQFLHDKETIVIGRVGEYCGSIFKAVRFSWLTDNALYALEIQDSIINLDYLVMWLTFINLNRFKKRSGQPLMTQSIIYSIKIPLPPLCEQEKIAANLSVINSEIENEITDRKNYESLKKSLMQVLLTGKVRVKLSQ